MGSCLLTLGAVGLLIAAGLREYGRRDPRPGSTIFQVGEDIRRRRGEEVAATYYENASRVRLRLAARWRITALVAGASLVLGVGLLVA